MKPYCNSMLLSDRIHFRSLFAFIEFLEKVPVIALNEFFKTVSEV